MTVRRVTPRVAVLALVSALISSTLVVLGLGAPAEAADDPCGPTGNAISCENSKPGTPRSTWDIVGAGDSSIQGFATDISVDVGGRIDLKIDTSASAYTIDVYRTGYYGGDGARLVGTVSPSAALPQTQPACITDLATELYDCGNWAVSASWDVPETAVSGVYVAKLTRGDNGDTSHVTFIVRDDASTSDVLFQTSDPTWHAYNNYGGSDFYRGGANGRAYKVSYNRPFATRSVSKGRDFYFSAEYAMVRFMEKNGYDVSYSSGVDTDRRGALLKNHKVFLSVGHDEYWSAAQRANVESARDAGVNLMFLSGNEAYWHTRYQPSADAGQTPYRTLVTYKETWANAKIDPSSEWTGTWRDPRFAPPSAGAGKPENAVTGTAYMANSSDLPVTVSAEEGRLRLWRDTSLSSMPGGSSQALAPHTVGYESNEDLDNGFRPEGLVRLSTTTGAVPEYLQDFGRKVAAGTTTHHLTLYRAASGALVFSAGSIQWSWGLDATHDGLGAPADRRMQQAQVNLFADMETQPTTLAGDLVRATRSADTTGPTTTITAPGAGAATNGEVVTAAGTATDTGGQVAGVEVSTDGGASWHPATGTTSWSYTYTQSGQGETPLLARAVDDSANIGAQATLTRTVSCPCTVYGQSVPATADSGDASAAELGLRFTPTTDGYVAGVRFYKATANTGTHVGTVWSSTGQQLARATFTNETASGWQTVSFSSPVRVVAGTTYVASYSAPAGHYTAVNNGLWYRGIDATPLKVAGGYDASPAGVYAGLGAFPTKSYQRGQYYVDPVFTLTDTSPLTVTTQSPVAGATTVPATSTISAVLSKPVDAASVGVTVKDANGAGVAGSTTYDPATRTVTFRPAQALSGFVQHTVTVTAKDVSGAEVSAGQSWSFTTAKPDPAPGVCPCTLFSDSSVPGTVQAADTAAVTLGVKFSAKVDGTVTGLRFYKGPGNTGTHVGTLWSATGSQLATATFSGESTSGWQTVLFSEPVPVTAGTQYVASYRTTVGRYSVTASGLANALDRAPLTTPAKAGLYTYGAGVPSTVTSNNYLVDVVFQKLPPSIAVAGQRPASGAVDADRDEPVQVWFTSPIAAGAAMSLTTGGTTVSGTTSLSPDRTVLTFTPAARLPAGAPVAVTVSGVTSEQGAVLADQSWSFTTSSSADAAAQTLFGAVTPATASVTDASPVEVGVAFSPTVDGRVTALRFFKGPGNGGVHRGTLWSSTGQSLATVTFAGESPFGWQSAKLSTPVALTAGTSYVVSYLAPQGRYASTTNFFSSSWSAGNLTAPATRNGRYLYGAAGGFPTNTSGATNYFVDVAFAPTPPPLTVTERAPAPDAVAVDAGTSVSMSFGSPLATGHAVTLSTGGTSVAGATTRSADGTTLTFDPAAPLAASTGYTVSFTGLRSTQGASLPDQTWSFTSAASSPDTLFTGRVPTTAAVTDAASVELGTTFTPRVNGQVTSVRFYKGVGNTGTHVGSVWSSTGTRLATVTFANETATGWQSATLSQPLSVVAGQSYVVSYLAPRGRYATTPNFFTSAWTKPRLTAPATNNGRYLYGAGGFPTTIPTNKANYFVDVGFVPAP